MGGIRAYDRTYGPACVSVCLYWGRLFIYRPMSVISWPACCVLCCFYTFPRVLFTFTAFITRGSHRPIRPLEFPQFPNQLEAEFSGVLFSTSQLLWFWHDDTLPPAAPATPFKCLEDIVLARASAWCAHKFPAVCRVWRLAHCLVLRQNLDKSALASL